MRRIGIALLLLSGLYAEAQLWACKPAAAQTYKGEAIHRTVVAFCISTTLHAPPCVTDDVGFVDGQTRVHFTKPIPESEMCAIMHRLGYQ